MKKHYLITLALLLSLSKAISVPIFNSYPSATATIYLDFDGHTVSGTTWNTYYTGGVPIYTQPCTLTNLQIEEVYSRVAEDFRPFNLNVTTDSNKFLSAPIGRRIRVIVTPTSSWISGVGGIAEVGSFKDMTDVPCFVFSDRLGPNSGKQIGETCSHEVGHTLGLDHQSSYEVSNCSYPVQEYNPGSGGGQDGWSPIMGNSLYRNFSTWNNGQIPWGCTYYQDNLSIITTQNGFGYRTDDYSETLNNTATNVANNFSVNGVISTNVDKDAFKQTLAVNSNLHITVTTSGSGVGANLDAKAELFNSSGTLIRTYEPSGTLNVTIDTILNAGTYYWRIDGTGNTNVNDYGSLGSYTFSGTSSALPIRSVVLSGNTEKANHNLSWKIISDEAIKTVVVENSTNGINFSPLSTLNFATEKFVYNPFNSNTIYYRIKVTSVINQTVYSNTITLINADNNGDVFKVSTLVQNELRINASENYQYQLTNLSGQQILKGNGVKGLSTIDVSKEAKGMFVLKLFATQKTYTEKIIKQ